ncbi:MAG: hypothetical protein ACTSUE_04140 [Promethearchaeota archaeon]
MRRKGGRRRRRKEKKGSRRIRNDDKTNNTSIHLPEGLQEIMDEYTDTPKAKRVKAAERSLINHRKRLADMISEDGTIHPNSIKKRKKKKKKRKKTKRGKKKENDDDDDEEEEEEGENDDARMSKRKRKGGGKRVTLTNDNIFEHTDKQLEDERIRRPILLERPELMHGTLLEGNRGYKRKRVSSREAGRKNGEALTRNRKRKRLYVNVRKTNNTIAEWREYARKQERVSDIVIPDMIQLQKKKFANKHTVDTSVFACFTDAEENIVSDNEIVMSMYPKGKSMVCDEMTEDDLKEIRNRRLRVTLEYHSQYCGRNHDPIKGVPPMFDRRLMEQRLKILDTEGIQDQYLGWNFERHLYQNSYLRKGIKNLYNSALNSTSRQKGKGFSNELCKKIKFLSVEDFDRGFRTVDDSICLNGERADFVCANAVQSSVLDNDYEHDPSLNDCQLWIHSGRRGTGHSHWDAHEWGSIQTYETRKPCLFCRAFTQAEASLRMKTNSREATSCDQQYASYVGITALKNGERTFIKDSMVPTNSQFTGLLEPLFLINMANLSWEPQHTKRADGNGYVPGFQVKNSAVFQEGSSRIFMNQFTKMAVNPRVHYTMTIQSPTSWNLLLGNLNILHCEIEGINVGGKEEREEEGEEDDDDEEEEVVEMNDKGGKISDNASISEHSESEVTLLKWIMRRGFFLEGQDSESTEEEGATISLNQPSSLWMTRMRKIYATMFEKMTHDDNLNEDHYLNFTTFNDFTQIRFYDFFALFRFKYKYCFWNPFWHERVFKHKHVNDYKIGMFPRLFVFMMRINMVMNAIIRLQVQLEGCYNVEKDINDVKDDENSNITVDHLKTQYDHKLYYLLKRLKQYLKAHMTAIKMIETIIQKNLVLMYIMRSLTFFEMIMPRRIQYEHSPFDIKRLRFLYKKHEHDPPREVIRKMIHSPQLQLEESMVFRLGSGPHSLLSLDIIQIDLDELAKSIRTWAQKDKNVLFTTYLCPAMTHFLPVDERTFKRLGTINTNAIPIPRQLFETDSWKSGEMCLIAKNSIQRKEIMIINGCAFMDPLYCSVFWALMLKVNVIQELMDRLKKEKEKLVATIVRLASEHHCDLDEENEKLKIEIDKIDLFTKELEKGFCKQDKTVHIDQQYRLLGYQLYIELHNHVPLCVEMISRQEFSDTSIMNDHHFRGKKKKGEAEEEEEDDDDVMMTGCYNLYHPYADQVLRAEYLPNIVLFMYLQNFDIKRKDLESLWYCMHKSFPSKCEIRKIEDMISDKYYFDKYIRKYMFGIIWCSIMGLYNHANHHAFVSNFPRLLKAHATYFSKRKMGGMNLQKRRDILFDRVSRNKFCIHDIIRENEVYFIQNYNPVLRRRYEEVWDGRPHIHWYDFRISCVLNMNLIREYFIKNDVIPNGEDRFLHTKKVAIQKRLKTLKGIEKEVKEQHKEVYGGYKRIVAILNDNMDTNLHGIHHIMNVIDEFKYSTHNQEIVFFLEKIVESVFGFNPREFQWARFLCEKNIYLRTSTANSVFYWQTSMGMQSTCYMVWKTLAEVRGKISLIDQTQRQKPLMTCGIYRVFNYGYTRTIIQIFKSLFEERMTCRMLAKESFPHSLIVPFDDAVIIQRISEFDGLGDLTTDYQRHYAKTFQFLHKECGLSFLALVMMCKTINLFHIKESENKMMIQLRRLSSTDYRLLNYYFMADHECQKIQTIPNRTISFVKLFQIQEKIRKNRINVFSVLPNVYKRRFGYNTENRKIRFPDPLANYTIVTRCCDRLTTNYFPYGSGNRHLSNKCTISDENVQDKHCLDSILCTCHLFAGNVIRCPRHSSILSTTDCIECCMFSKHNKKKRNSRSGKLIHDLQDAEEQSFELPESDNGLQKFRKRTKDCRMREKEDFRHIGLRLEECECDDNDITDDDDDTATFKSEEFVHKLFPDHLDTGTDDAIIQKIVQNEEEKAVRQYGGSNMYEKGGFFNKSNDDEEEEEEEEEEEGGGDEGNGSENGKKKKGRRGRKGGGGNTQKHLRPQYIPFEELKNHAGRNDSEGTDDVKMKNKEEKGGRKRKKKQRQERKSDSLINIKVGDDLQKKTKKIANRYFKFTKSYPCNNPSKKGVIRIKTFGNTVLIRSNDEDVSVYRWCPCGSFIKYDQALFRGSHYMCESCWGKLPEGCSYFFDELRKDNVVILTMGEKIDICTRVLNETEVLEKRLELLKKKYRKDEKKRREGVSITVEKKTDEEEEEEEEEEGEEEEEWKKKKKKKKTRKSSLFVKMKYQHTIARIQHVMKRKTKKTIMIDHNMAEQIERMRGEEKERKKEEKLLRAIVDNDDKGTGKTKRKKRKRSSAFIVHKCLSMRRYFLIEKMNLFRVYDDNIDDNSRDNLPIKTIQTQRGKWRFDYGYFSRKRNLHNLNLLRYTYEKQRTKRSVRRHNRLGTNRGRVI